MFRRIIKRQDWLQSPLMSPKLGPWVSALQVLERKQRIGQQLLTFIKEEIVFQQWIAGLHILVASDAWPNPLVLSGIKCNPELCRISISNYFPVTHFGHLGELPRDLLPRISWDQASLSAKQAALGSTLWSFNHTVSSSDTQILLWSLQDRLSRSSETWPKSARPPDTTRWITCVGVEWG